MTIPEAIKSRWHYGWAIFALTIINLSIEGGTSKSAGVFLVALRSPEAFGRSAAATAAVFSAAGVVGMLASPFLGRALDRLGPKFLFTAAAFFLLVGWVGSSMAGDLWHLFLTYSIIATLGQNSLGSFAGTANLAPWFPKNRGRALGLADVGNPLGQAILVPLSQILISTIGWRGAFQVIGLAFFLLVAPVNAAFQRRPPGRRVASGSPTESATTAITISASNDGAGAATPPLTVRQLAARPALWLLFLTRSLVTFGNQMTSIYLISYFLLSGYSDIWAATTIGLVGVLSLGGRPMTGAISDRWGREAAFTLGTILHICSLLVILQFADGASVWPLLLFVAFAGLSDGFSGLLIGTKAADLFPANSLGTVMGVVEMGRGVGIAVGPVLGGLLFDLRGDYTTTFMVAIVLQLGATAMMWLTGLKRLAPPPP